MEKEELCPYASECSFYNGKIEDNSRPRFFVLNVFCRGGRRGWTGCKRYELYAQDTKPEEDLLPSGATSEEKVKINHPGNGE